MSLSIKRIVYHPQIKAEFYYLDSYRVCCKDVQFVIEFRSAHHWHWKQLGFSRFRSIGVLEFDLIWIVVSWFVS